VLRPEVDRYVDSRAFVGRLDIALAGSAEIVQDVVACGSLEEGRFGMAVACGRNCATDQALLFTYRPTPGTVRGVDGGGSGLHTPIVEISRQEGALTNDAPKRSARFSQQR